MANWQLEKSNERKATEKKTSFEFNFWVWRKKLMASKLFEFVEQFVIVCLPFNNRNALNLKKAQVKSRKIKIELEQIFRLFPKNKQKNQQYLYKSTNTI